MWLKSGRVRCFYLAYLSRPAHDRPIYQLIRRHRLRRIVEIGVGLAQRSARMIEVSAATAGPESVVFSGVDLFELRTPQAGPGLSLKQTHRRLAATGAKIRLLPGDAYGALSRAVNMLGTADLVVISADQDRPSLGRAWYFIERLLQDHSQVVVQQEGSNGEGGAFRMVPHGEIRQLAAAGSERRRAA